MVCLPSAVAWSRILSPGFERSMGALTRFLKWSFTISCWRASRSVSLLPVSKMTLSSLVAVCAGMMWVQGEG